GEVDQVAVGALPLARGGPDVHDVEGRDRGAGGLVQGRDGSAHPSTLEGGSRRSRKLPPSRASPQNPRTPSLQLTGPTRPAGLAIGALLILGWLVVGSYWE